MIAHLEKFHPIVRGWFLDEYKKPSPPQEKGWPVIAAGKHTLILAPTGSGKTLAAFLWCIDELFRLGLQVNEHTFAQNPSGVHTLYISPLKALNNDIERNLRKPLKGVSEQAKALGQRAPSIRVVVRTGDTPSHVRQFMVRTPPHILITTPESFYLLLTSERGRAIFKNVKYLIADEIHAISNNKRGVHLSLSMERLITLTKTEPVRIGLSATQRPLDRIAAFLGGQSYVAQAKLFKPRPVTIIDCGQNKAMDLKVISPVKSFSDLPESTVWPQVIRQLYELIQKHRTTLVFVNMRAHTEKIARQLNELHQIKTDGLEAKLAYSHHGSMSREMRFETEEKLKDGKISAVIATSSLELGIDIGSIDLVIQLEAPTRVSAILQRVGRSGHLLSSKSKGRIIPLYPSDLDDTLALTRCAKEGEIEETFVPENSLDVLAQQILAEVSMRNWSRSDLYILIRKSYCYRHLPQMVFDKTLDMLSGSFAESKIPALQPRITWDRVNDKLITRRGTRLLAIMNGGTIPDRGYYTVVLSEDNLRLGEMEEEFVFESKIGDIFFLGNNEWRIESITQDKIIVSPHKSTKPRAPFWKGEIPFRDYHSCTIIAKFRDMFNRMIDTEHVTKTLVEKYYCDEEIVQNMIDYFERQKALTRVIPTQDKIVVEHFYDSADDLNYVVHAPFGGRVTTAWAMALASLLTHHLGCEVQFAFNDDGFLLRIQETEEKLAIEKFLKIPANEVEQRLIDILINSPIFAIQFRYNAARALMLSRSQPGRRIPLWLQRLRAADLLQAVKNYPDFPLLLETYRTCLEDYFDLPALLKVLKQINQGDISLHFINTPHPSPMASGLLFNFLTTQMYDYDRIRNSGEIANISSVLLAQILSKEKIPALITQEQVKKTQQRWQHLTAESKAKGQEDLFAIIEKLGPLQDSQIRERSRGNFKSWLSALSRQNRIIKLQETYKGWVVQSHRDIYIAPHNAKKAQQILKRYLRVRGPVTQYEIKQRLNIKQALLHDLLNQLLSDKEIVHGILLKDSAEDYWCDRNTFTELYRAAIAQRRQTKSTVNKSTFITFLLNWQKLGNTGQSITDIIEHCRGVRFAPYIFEREIIRSRFLQEDVSIFHHVLNEFYDLIAQGEIIPLFHKEGAEQRPQLSFNTRGQGAVFDGSRYGEELLQSLSENDQLIYRFLKENGASFASDIEDGTNLSSIQLFDSLSRLALISLISCDDYDAFLSLLQSNRSSKIKKKISPTHSYNSPLRSYRANRRMLRKKISQRLQVKSGRWFLTSSFAVSGKSLDLSSKAEKQTRILLQRYGILVKEWYRREQGFLPWYQIFQTLKRLEWQGEIFRGYFIEGLSGIQFALPQAVDLLERINSGEISVLPPTMISTVDPALPFGGHIDWDSYDTNDKKVSVTRNPGNHIIFIQGRQVCYCENYATKIFTLKSFNNSMLADIINQIKSFLHLSSVLRPRKRISIELIDNKIAIESQFARDFLSSGFEQEGKKLVLWPSGV